MPTPSLHYHAPDTLSAALALLDEHGQDAALLAGGTDVVPALKYGIARTSHLVSLSRIPGLAEVSLAPGGGVAVGALTTLRDVVESPLVRRVCPALAEAAAQAGSPLLRNRGTLGGNVCLDTRCWYFNQDEAWRASRPLCQKAGGDRCFVNEKQNRCVALFCADTPAVLMCVAAHATLAGPRGERDVPVAALYTADGLHPIARQPAEIVLRIVVPAAAPRSGAAYVKHSVRESIDFPLVGAAAAVALGKDGLIATGRVALTGVGSAPVFVPGIESALVGRRPSAGPDRALAELASRSIGPLFLTDTVPHKRLMTGIVVAEAVARAAARAAGRES